MVLHLLFDHLICAVVGTSGNHDVAKMPCIYRGYTRKTADTAQRRQRWHHDVVMPLLTFLCINKSVWLGAMVSTYGYISFLFLLSKSMFFMTRWQPFELGDALYFDSPSAGEKVKVVGEKTTNKLFPHHYLSSCANPFLPRQSFFHSHTWTNILEFKIRGSI